MPAEPGKEKLLVQVLRKIPIFKGLSPTHVKTILSLCSHRTCQPEEKICQSNSPSDEMYILLAGELVVVTAEGVKVATILPVTTVGEMGVITGELRSATVEVSKPSNVFTLRKASFDHTMKEDREMRATFYRNIIDVMSLKLKNDNVRLRDHQIERDRFQGQISVLQRQLDQQQARTNVAIELAANYGDVSRDEVDLQINDQVKDLIPRILVVDDESEFRSLVKRALPYYLVLEAEDGQAALDVVREEQLSLVLTDIRMPKMDGFALLTNLRGQFPDLPVLAVSGYVDADDVDKHEFDGFIDKPVSLKHLQAVVEEVVNKDR
jgi:CheY-like chemotaxis protein